MRARILSCLLLVFSLLAAGCDSADSTLSNFEKGLRKDDLPTFEKALKGEALARYGNPAAFEELRVKLAGLKFKVGHSELLSYECHPNDFLCRDHEVTYRFSILAAPRAAHKPSYAEINTAVIWCIEVDHGLVQVNEDCVLQSFAHDF